MNRKKRWLSFVAVLLVMVTVLSLSEGMAPQQVKASKISELQKQKEELEAEKAKIDEEISKLQGQLSDNLGSMEAIFAQKSIIEQEIFQLYRQEQILGEQIATINLMIADKQAELEDAESRLTELQLQNKERIRAMEENGNTSYWSVLFKANSFSEFLDNLSMIQEIAASDERRLQEIKDVADEVELAKQELEAQKTELEATKKELETSRVKSEARREEADQLLAQLIATGEEYEKLLEQAEEDSYKVGLDLSETVSDLKQAEYEQWLSTSKAPEPAPPNVSSGTVVDGLTWIVPCYYTVLTSRFGWREHPVYGGQRFHYGVDLAGPMGTTIKATRAGKVTTATYASDAGYYVVIDHGDGFVSKYMHMTHFIVSVGDTVSAGQKIGEMGSTGASTGSHLHFGLMYKGNYVDPMLYIG